jgi:tripartite-type tricarboxylate transporter receptor subunit TctC
MKEPVMRSTSHWISAAILAVAATVANAQAWPSRPVRFFVAGAAASAPDLIARLLGESLTGIWGQQVIVDNRPGAAGNLGTAAAAKAPADGYNFLFGQAAPLAMNQYTFKTLPFDVEKDLVPVINAGLSPLMIAVNNDLPVRNLAELIALAKAQPGTINFGTSSSRNILHLAGAMLANTAGIKLVHVPYKSNSQAAAETASGLTQIYIDGVPAMFPHIQSNRLRILAVTSARRLPEFPDIPTVAETLPGFNFKGWFAIMAPAGTPPDVIARINRDANTVLQSPAMVARLAGLGIYDAGGTPEQLASFLRSERDAYARAVKAAAIEPE